MKKRNTIWKWIISIQKAIAAATNPRTFNCFAPVATVAKVPPKRMNRCGQNCGRKACFMSKGLKIHDYLKTLTPQQKDFKKGIKQRKKPRWKEDLEREKESRQPEIGLEEKRM